MIKHDRSATSIVTTCARCSYWFAFNFDMELARASGERHMLNVHDVEPRDASHARRQAEYRKRHAKVS